VSDSSQGRDGAARKALPLRAANELASRGLTRIRLARDLALPGGRTYAYGADRSQHAELHLPAGEGPHAVVVLIHGGSWYKRFSKIVMRSLARDLRRRGFAVWNIEYRRVGNGGGWPHTLSDVAAAIDHLRAVREPLDLRRVSVVGHSAGGQLALWAAGRPLLSPGVPGGPSEGANRDGARVALTHAVALAGVCDLAGAYRAWRGGAVQALMGGSPAELPERYAVADPMQLLPLQIPVLLVHGTTDATVSVKLSRSYARAATAAGAAVELIEIDGPAGGHREHIDPHGGAWLLVAQWLEGAARAREREPAPTS
jgi:acetyl esterase/lipase